MSALHDLGARLLRATDPERAHELSLAALAAGLVRRRWNAADDQDQSGLQGSWSQLEA